ncbi:MAG TPA: hypothetical protein DEF42_10495 [Desulfosporosinus sp.]|nr:hypothetical protein [Desulfosporosinus sp.]
MAKSMYQKKYLEVEAIVEKTKNGWKIDFKKLGDLANGHRAFMEAVRRCYKENEGMSWLYGIKVFSWEKKPGAGGFKPWLGVAFRTANSVSYFACCPDGVESNFIVEAHYNEDFVAQMAEIL